MAEASISPRSTAWARTCSIKRFALVEELLLHHGVELGAARNLDEHRADGAGMGARVSADRLAQLQQVTAQRAGVGRDRDLPGAFDECGQHQFGLRRPPSVERGLAGPRSGGHRIHGQSVIAVFLKQLQRHREQLGLPRRPRANPRRRRNSGSRGPPWKQGTSCVRVSGIVTHEPGKRLSGLPDDGVHAARRFLSPVDLSVNKSGGAVAKISSAGLRLPSGQGTSTSVSSRCQRSMSATTPFSPGGCSLSVLVRPTSPEWLSF